MKLNILLSITGDALKKLSKSKLIRIICAYSEAVKILELKHKEEIGALKKELAEKDSALDKIKQQQINLTVNQPTSKEPEWGKKDIVEPKVGKKDRKKKRKKRKKSKARKGAGNKAKRQPEVVNLNPLISCPDCSTDLTHRPVISKPIRIIEDLPPPPAKTVISQEVQEKKWCPHCKKVQTSASPRGLPKSDFGLNAVVLIAYLWVISCISLPGIVSYLKSFFQMAISTAGISRLMIRLGKILAPVHEEIRQDVKNGAIIFADETGWRVHGVLWWLWIFANERSAYYWPDKQRGSPVVDKVIGTIFSGVLITDAWHAYQKIVCTKQTCMAHICRKVRKFRDAYPQYWSLVLFYQRLRRILEDGEKLKLLRSKIDELTFQRRLKLLELRLNKLLKWAKPNKILREVIKKVLRQRAYILTFVSHPGVPKHNNFGEYIIKRGILKRKVSGGSMSPEGAMAYAQIQSIAMTCHLRGYSFKDYLLKCLLKYIKSGKPLLLAEYGEQFTTEVQEKNAA